MEFQFHKGTIRTHDEAEELFRILKNFNSIKVRLEPVSQHVGEENVPFQFHKGTIRTCPRSPEGVRDSQISIP